MFFIKQLIFSNYRIICFQDKNSFTDVSDTTKYLKFFMDNFSKFYVKNNQIIFKNNGKEEIVGKSVNSQIIKRNKKTSIVLEKLFNKIYSVKMKKEKGLSKKLVGLIKGYLNFHAYNTLTIMSARTVVLQFLVGTIFDSQICNENLALLFFLTYDPKNTIIFELWEEYPNLSSVDKRMKLLFSSKEDEFMKILDYMDLLEDLKNHGLLHIGSFTGQSCRNKQFKILYNIFLEATKEKTKEQKIKILWRCFVNFSILRVFINLKPVIFKDFIKASEEMTIQQEMIFDLYKSLGLTFRGTFLGHIKNYPLEIKLTDVIEFLEKENIVMLYLLPEVQKTIKEKIFFLRSNLTKEEIGRIFYSRNTIVKMYPTAQVIATKSEIKELESLAGSINFLLKSKTLSFEQQTEIAESINFLQQIYLDLNDVDAILSKLKKED